MPEDNISLPKNVGVVSLLFIFDIVHLVGIVNEHIDHKDKI